MKKKGERKCSFYYCVWKYRAELLPPTRVFLFSFSLYMLFFPNFFLCPLFWPKRDSDMELDREGRGWIKKRIPNPISVPSNWNSNLLKTPIYPF